MKKTICIACIIFLNYSAGLRAEHFKFATFEFPPLEYSENNKEQKGIAVEIVRLVMKNLGHTVTIDIYPWERSIRMAKEGHTDALFTAYRTPEREVFLDYSNEVLVPQIVALYIKKGDSFTYNGNIHALSGKKIGTMSTISYGTLLDRERKNLQTITSYTLESNFRMLERGNLDIVISNIYTGDYTLVKSGQSDKIIRVTPEIERIASYIAFSKKKNRKDLRDQFDKELKRIKATGEYDVIFRKYGIQP